MKRNVGPGAKIPLDDLFEQYGERHNLKKGKEFVQWLQEVKLRDKSKWRIFKTDDTPYEEKVQEEKKVEAPIVETKKARGDNVPTIVTKEITVDEVVELSVRKAREIIPTIHDIQLLKYAENQANQRAGKDSLRIILMKRIEELKISSRR
jgi:hypothetical protein